MSRGTILGVTILCLVLGICILTPDTPKKPSATDATAFEKLRAEYCTPERTRGLRQAFRTEISGPTDRANVEAFVEPSVWAGLEYQTRKDVAMHLATCSVTNATTMAHVTIRHGNTGRDLATFSPELGYRNVE